MAYSCFLYKVIINFLYEESYLFVISVKWKNILFQSTINAKLKIKTN